MNINKKLKITTRRKKKKNKEGFKRKENI